MAKSKGRPRSTRYDFKFKLDVVRTSLEKKLAIAEITKTYGISDATWQRWKGLFKKDGEEALRRDGPSGKSETPLPEGHPKLKQRQQILETKRQYPFFGIVRVWHWLRRTAFLPISQRFVRKTLTEENLLIQPEKRRRRSPEPKRFERARPNQLWQSDITAFTVAKGLRVYLIGFMDDHSRYMVGWGLYAGQSGGLVLEVFRNAISTYGRPEEVLTDNGRQYKSWQGITDFQRELQREGIKHITSRPHHPQTLGKIEGFWGHLKREFLRRVVMGGLEDMRERLGHWINFYNFQRPNQGIDHATPAERFFKFSSIAREEIERRIKKNEKDLAFADPQPRSLIGQAAIGDTPVEVRKKNGEFIVLLGGQEVNRTELDGKKEATHGSEEGPVGPAGTGGEGSPGEGGRGTVGAVGGEIDRGGLPGGGPEGDRLLQARGADAPVDARDGEDAGPARPAEGSSGGGDEPGLRDGGAAPGAPAAAEPGAGDAQARRPEAPRPGEAPEGGIDSGDAHA